MGLSMFCLPHSLIGETGCAMLRDSWKMCCSIELVTWTRRLWYTAAKIKHYSSVCLPDPQMPKKWDCLVECRNANCRLTPANAMHHLALA